MAFSVQRKEPISAHDESIYNSFHVKRRTRSIFLNFRDNFSVPMLTTANVCVRIFKQILHPPGAYRVSENIETELTLFVNEVK